MQVVWGIMGYDFRALQSVLSLWNSDIFAVSEKQRNQTVESKYLTLTTPTYETAKQGFICVLTDWLRLCQVSVRQTERSSTHQRHLPSHPSLSVSLPPLHISLWQMYENRPLLQDRGRRGGELWIGEGGGGLDLIDKCLRVAFTARSHFVCVHTDCTYWMSVRFILSFCEATTWTAHLNSTLMFDWD